MKRIELRRHSTKTGPGNQPLSEEGVRLAERVGATELRGKGYTHLYVSTLIRTTQTLEAFARGAEDFPPTAPQVFPVHTQVGETEEAIALWRGASRGAEDRGEDMLVAALRDDPERSARVAQAGADAFRAWVATLPEEARILVIGHSPFFELIAFGLFGERLPQLQPCEGFCVEEQDGSLTLVFC